VCKIYCKILTNIIPEKESQQILSFYNHQLHKEDQHSRSTAGLNKNMLHYRNITSSSFCQPFPSLLLTRTTRFFRSFLSAGFEKMRRDLLLNS